MSERRKAIDVLLRRFGAHGVVAVSDDVPAGRGMVLKENVEPNNIIFHVPGSALLNVKTAAAFLHADLLPTSARPSARQGCDVESTGGTVPCFGTGQGLQGGSSSAGEKAEAELPLSSVQALSLLLLLWRRRSRTSPSSLPPVPEPLADFARTLPVDFDSVPLLWSLCQDQQSRLCAALVEALPAHSRQRLLDVRKRFAGDAHMVSAVLRLRPDLLPAWSSEIAYEELVGDDLLDDFYWAWLCVNSRCLYLPLGLKTREDNFTMAPVIDLINHTFDKSIECKVEYPAEGMQIRAPKSDPKAFNVTKVRTENGNTETEEQWQRGCSKGDELFITYGAHSNEFLLAEYGFVLPIATAPEPSALLDLPNNPFAEVVVDDLMLELLASAQSSLVQAELKRELLRERSYWLDWTIHPTGEPSHRLVCALRLLALDLNGSQQESGATVAVLGHKASKRLRLQKQAPQHQPQETKPPSSEAETSEAQLARISEWESMVSGSTEFISQENEEEARKILVKVCETVQDRTRKRRRALEDAFNMPTSYTSDGTGASKAGQVQLEVGRWIQSFRIVRSLLIEQEHIARIVLEATKSTQEPW
ncbi:hypothetical protein OC835_001654 [Tilletia horrida]|nr:hypothetical protein OC835_001654 [Tilletia horrida]